MTQKELLYMEDAIKHEANLVNIYSDFIENLEDTNLKSFLKSEMKKHQVLKQKLLKTMDGALNE